jgi:ABC-type uncharacterized transport system ATPase subunit
MTAQPLVEFKQISKTYPNGTVALSEVSFSIEAGGIHAICGENGAGKSTLMKILFGLERPSSGSLVIEGIPTVLASPRDAGAHGIGMVHQHFSLLSSLTVAENIVLGYEPRMGGVLLDRRKARKIAQGLSARYGLSVDPDALVSSLSVAMQQKVEILKALSREARLLILDEPTAVLTPVETEELFERLIALKREGVTTLFISHKLKEVRALASDVTVLRNGKVSGSAALRDVTDAEITRLAMGRTIAPAKRDVQRARGAVSVSIRHLTRDDLEPAMRVSDICLDVHAGQVIGIAGVDGAGQEGLVRLLSGESRPQHGEIEFNGHQVAGASKAALRKLGFAHLPADRFRAGSAPQLNLMENAIAGAHRSRILNRGPLLRRRAAMEATRKMIEAYDVRCSGPAQRLGTLSGGNVQKLVAAREFGSCPSFLIAEEPTRGIDIQAASFVHQQLLALADTGAAILLLTSDLDELIRLSDHIVVMFGGRIVSRIDNYEGLSPEHLGAAMLGLEAGYAQ